MKLTLEIIAGIFLLLIITIGGLTWWIGQPENRTELRSWMIAQINDNLDNGESVTYQDFIFSLSANPLGVKMVLKNTTYQRPNLLVSIRKADLTFHVADLIAGSRIPRNMVIDQPILINTGATDNSSFEAAELSAGLLFSITPDQSPDKAMVKMLQNVDSFTVRNLHLGWGSFDAPRSFTGDVQWTQEPTRTLRIEGEYNDPTSFSYTPSHVTLKIERQAEDLLAALHGHLSPALLENIPALTNWRRWLENLGDEGYFEAKTRISLSAWQEALRALRSPAPTAILDIIPLEGKLLWPDINPAYQLHITRQPQQAATVSLQGLRTFPAPIIDGHHLPDIESLSLYGTVDPLWQNVDLAPTQLRFTDQTSVEFAGNYDRYQKIGELRFSAQGVDQSIIPHRQFLPSNTQIFSGKIQDITAQLKIADNRLSIDSLQSQLNDLNIKINGVHLSSPHVIAKLDDPHSLTLDTPQGMTYQSFPLDYLHLEGNPRTKLNGFARISVDDRLIETALLQATQLFQNTLPAGALTFAGEAPLEANFALDMQSFDFQVQQLRLAEKKQLQFQDIPLQVENLTYLSTPSPSIQASGAFQQAPFVFSVHEKNKTLRFFSEIKGLELHNMLAPTFQSRGTIDAQLSGIFDSTLQQVSLNADLDKVEIDHADLGAISVMGDQGILKIDVRPNGALWQVSTKGAAHRSVFDIVLDYDSEHRLVTQIQDSHFTYAGEKTMISGVRDVEGLSLQLSSQTLSHGKPIIAFMKTPTTSIPHIFAPVKSISWNFDDSFHSGDIAFGQGKMSVQFATHDPNGDAYLVPGFNILEMFTFDFVEPEPVRVYRGDSDQDGPSLSAPQLNRHEITFIPNKLVKMHSPNTGKFLRFLDLSHSVSGGVTRMELLPVNQQLEGHLNINNFQVKNNNGAVKFLEAISLTGLIPLIANDGVPFFVLDANVKGKIMKWGIEDLKAYGPGLSITFNGRLDIDQETLEGRGAASPTSILNAALSKIPLIGELLTGSDGGGLVAANFNVTGSIDDPEIFTSPLSLLTPGILRNIFGGIGDALSG